jgi:hypothetical protein
MPIYGHAKWPDYNPCWFPYNEDNDIVRIFEVNNDLTNKMPECRPEPGQMLYDSVYNCIVY